jgi:hypothetical protein
MNSPNRFRQWLAEPLLHFLVIGALLFALDAWWTSRASNASGGTIVVSESRIKALAENFRRTWQRLPTKDELDGLIETHVRDDILTREAERLGLASDDTVIRRRLRQKLEIITEEASMSEAVSDAQLQTFLDAHADAFRGEAKIAFEQVFFDPAKRGARIEADMRVALEKLNANRRPTSADFAKNGDALFVLQASYPLSGTRQIGTLLGEPFAAELAELAAAKPESWFGPIESGYGWHLIRVTGFEPGQKATLDEVRPQVEREWRNARRVQARDAQYATLREQYTITVKWPQAAAKAAP